MSHPDWQKYSVISLSEQSANLSFCYILSIQLLANQSSCCISSNSVISQQSKPINFQSSANHNSCYTQVLLIISQSKKLLYLKCSWWKYNASSLLFKLLDKFGKNIDEEKKKNGDQFKSLYGDRENDWNVDLVPKFIMARGEMSRNTNILSLTFAS